MNKIARGNMVNHFVPAYYISKWSELGNRKGKVKEIRKISHGPNSIIKFPKKIVSAECTGYIKGLYSDHVETAVSSQYDFEKSKVLKVISNPDQDLNNRYVFAQIVELIYSQGFRHPQNYFHKIHEISETFNTGGFELKSFNRLISEKETIPFVRIKESLQLLFDQRRHDVIRLIIPQESNLEFVASDAFCVIFENVMSKYTFFPIGPKILVGAGSGVIDYKYKFKNHMPYFVNLVNCLLISTACHYVWTTVSNKISFDQLRPFGTNPIISRKGSEILGSIFEKSVKRDVDDIRKSLGLHKYIR